MAKRGVKKKTTTIDGQTISQNIQDTEFARNFSKWASGDEFDFLIRHGIGTPRKNSTFDTSKGHAKWLPRVVDIVNIRGVLKDGDLDHLEKYVEFLEGEGGKGTKYDPSMIIFHEKVYDENTGKFLKKRPVYGHWATKYKTERAKGKYGKEAVGQYSYEKKHNPKHKVANAIWGSGQLLEILKAGIEELPKIPTPIVVNKISSAKKLLQIPEVKSYLEGLMTSNYFKEGKMKPSSIINALKGKVFKLTKENEAVFREITGLSEEEVIGKIEFVLQLGAATVERAYMASKKKKAGGYFIHGKTMDKRPRKDGEIVSKMWMELFV